MESINSPIVAPCSHPLVDVTQIYPEKWVSPYPPCIPFRESGGKTNCCAIPNYACITAVSVLLRYGLCSWNTNGNSSFSILDVSDKSSTSTKITVIGTALLWLPQASQASATWSIDNIAHSLVTSWSNPSSLSTETGSSSPFRLLS